MAYLERGRNALHGDGPATFRVDAPLDCVHRDGECVPQGDGREEHLDADQEILKGFNKETNKTHKNTDINLPQIIKTSLHFQDEICVKFSTLDAGVPLIMAFFICKRA